MMRGTVSLILIFLFSLQPVSAAAQERVPNPQLQGRLHDVSGEVARFTELHSSPIALTGGQEADKAERIRAKAQALPLSTEVMFTLKDGDKVEGVLTDRTNTDFTVRVSVSEETRAVLGDDATTRKSFRFADIDTFRTELDSRNIRRGEKVEVGLVEGEIVTGRLNAADDNGLTVDDRQFTFDEVLSVKTLTRSKTKTFIIVGIAAGVALLLAAAYAAAAGA